MPRVTIIPTLNIENPDFNALRQQAWQAVGSDSGADYDSFALGFNTALTSILGSLASPARD
ncbi:MAG TPA: hypothetical protein V6D00_04745 [Pantanalinema sp.]